MKITIDEEELSKKVTDAINEHRRKAARHGFVAGVYISTNGVASVALDHWMDQLGWSEDDAHKVARRVIDQMQEEAEK